MARSERLQPNCKELDITLHTSGYSFEAAVADIIDDSIETGAKTVLGRIVACPDHPADLVVRADRCGESGSLANAESVGKIGENRGFPEGNLPSGLLAELADAMDSKSIRPDQQAAKSQRVTNTPENRLSPDLSVAVAKWPELAGLIRAWPELPAAIRTAVLVLIRATKR